jgi:hypothetical protein
LLMLLRLTLLLLLLRIFLLLLLLLLLHLFLLLLQLLLLFLKLLKLSIHSLINDLLSSLGVERRERHMIWVGLWTEPINELKNRSIIIDHLMLMSVGNLLSIDVVLYCVLFISPLLVLSILLLREFSDSFLFVELSVFR